MKFNNPLITPAKQGVSIHFCLSLLLASNIGHIQAAENVKPVKAPIQADNDVRGEPKETDIKEYYSREELINSARQDLVKMLKIDANDVKVLSSAQVTWKSGALGCPRAGELYTQALVPGVLIVLGAQGKHYRYHGKRTGLTSYCPNQYAESPAPKSSDI